MTRKIVSLGTNHILKGQAEMAIPFAMAILEIETSGGDNDMSFSEALLSMADLAHDRERETTRFFAKRIDCTCLKEKYAQVKTQPKIGFCDHCHQKKKRRELMLCTRCGHVQYCSEKCQRDQHEELCVSPPKIVRTKFGLHCIESK